MIFYICKYAKPNQHQHVRMPPPISKIPPQPVAPSDISSFCFFFYSFYN